MKILSWILIIMLALVHVAEGKTVSVKGYYRKNGTYVRPHVRHTKGSSYSTGGSTKSYGGSGNVHASGFSPASVVGWNSSAAPKEPPACLDTCKAIYDNGRRCSRWVESGKEYCASHIGYDPNNKPHYEELDLPSTDLEKVIATKEKLDKVRKAIDYYSDERGGALPDDLATLRAMNPTFMAPPTKDAWGRSFSCGFSDDGFVVRSAGPDAKLGTDDDLILLMER